MIRAILACDDMWGIGKDGTLPWAHNYADLKWFKQNTEKNVVVMGRRTWESLPIKPLPNRRNIVVSDTLKNLKDIEIVDRDIYKSRIMFISNTNDVWVIGGAQLIEDCLSLLDEIWLSRIPGKYSCDTFLPRSLIEIAFEKVSSKEEDSVQVDKWRRL